MIRAGSPGRRFVVLTALAIHLALPAYGQERDAGRPSPAAVSAPTPREFFGFEPGTDRKLAGYEELCAYVRTLDQASDRIESESIGLTTEGRDFLVAYVSSPSNMGRRDEIRRANLELAHPTSLRPGRADELIANGKGIVFLNASIHSVEVGPAQATATLLHRLATSDDPEILRILDELVLVVTPCHNPDGYVKQVDWYRSRVGTPHEGAPLPELYHRYVGHDNNRDWFLFSQVESRLTIDKLHAEWRPQIVVDRHQMGEDGPRLFVPPYQAPIEPHVDPALMSRLADLGRSIHADFAERGLSGVASDALFDAWSPSRAYIHYHGGVRVLTEIASARQASPVENVRVRKPWNSASEKQPLPWPGGRWSLGDIVRYDVEVSLAVLRHAARERSVWLRTFHDALKRGAAPRDGLAGYFLVGKDGADLPPDTTDELRRILGLGGLQFDHVDADGVFPRGIYVRAGQPFFPFVEALFENVAYPEVRDGGVLRRPYDVTCHHLPTLMGFEARRLREAPPLSRGLGKDAFGPARGEDRYAPPPKAVKPGPPIAIYRSYSASMDEGWLRYFCDRRGFAYRSFVDADMKTSLVVDRGRNGGPELRPDGPKVLVIPDLTRAELDGGPSAKTMPREFQGGLGPEGRKAVRDFVVAGGTLIAIKDATAWTIDLFDLPLKNAALEASSEDGPVHIPGAALRILAPDPLAPTSVVRKGWPKLGDAGTAVLFTTNSKAFVTATAPAGVRAANAPQVLYRYAEEDRLALGGYVGGGATIAGKAAVVRTEAGRGSVVLFGFVPYFRYQTQSAFPLLEAALVDTR